MPIYFSNAPISEPFTLYSVGNNWNQETTLRPKGYPHYHYLHTQKGCGSMEVHGQTYILNEGEGILIAPFVRHSYSSISEEWVTSFFTFTGTIESTIPKILDNRQVIFTEKEQGTAIDSLISKIMEKYKHPPVDAKSLSIDSYRLLMFFVNGFHTRDLLNEPLYQRYIAPVLKEIETNYARELTIQHLSSKVFVTPQYLSRLFRRFLGVSPYEYLTNYRMNKAKELLLTKPGMEIQAISHQAGFSDTSHFIAMFKKTTGYTPLEFRRLN